MRAGFTLIEIVMVLALVALASSVVIANFGAFADRGDERTTEEQISAAVRKARLLAAQHRSLSELQFDKESGSLIVTLDGAEAASFSLDEDFGRNGRGQIRFFLVAASRGLEPFSEPAETQLETTSVRFAPDRSASPYLVEIDQGHSTPERILYDPFSSLRKASPQ